LKAGGEGDKQRMRWFDGITSSMDMYFQHRNRDTGHTESRGEGVSGMSSEIRTDIYMLPCVT